jgi:putative transposase
LCAGFLLKREGQTVNHKRVYRIDRAKGLAVRCKARKKLAAGERGQKPPVSAANQRWSMDFRSDQLASGQRFRVLNVVDDFTRECLVMQVGTSITGADVARLLTTVLVKRAQPTVMVTDNGPEFISKALDQWAMSAASFSSSIGLENQSRTPISKVLTAEFEMNV